MNNNPTIRIMGIVGSPRKKGNTDVLVKEALKSAKEAKDVETEILYLANLKFSYCTGCLLCMKNKYCPLKDDINQQLFKKLVEEIDGFIFGTPVYFRHETGLMKSFIDRLQPIATGDYMGLLNKPAVVIAVGAVRTGGQSIASLALWASLIDMGLIVVGPDTLANWGAWSGIVDPDNSQIVQVNEDEAGLTVARNLGRRVAEVARALKIGLPKTKYVSEPAPGIPRKYGPPYVTLENV